MKALIPAILIALGALPLMAQDATSEQPAPAADAKAAEAKDAEAPATKEKAADKAKEEIKVQKPEGEKAPIAGTPIETAKDAPALPNEKLPDLTTTSTSVSAADVDLLRKELKEEISAELREQMKAELETAAKDAANQRSAKLEWEEEKWVEEVKPQLNFLEFNGYFRSRFDYFNNLDLGTYDPIRQRGTSGVAPPSYYRPFDGEDCPDDGFVEGYPCSQGAEGSKGLTSMNMRLRLDPTLNVSEDIRIRTTVDIMDNVIFGSTPNVVSTNNPIAALSEGQLTLQEGFNSAFDAIRFKRLWAEVDTPFGQLRVGRQPQQFGMGLLLNDGNQLDQDYGDSADQIQFSTTIPGLDLLVTPAYASTAAGAVGRGGAIDAGAALLNGEGGQRYNLDPRDDVHNFQISVLKRDKDEDVKARLRDGNLVFNYGAYFSYKTQTLDNPSAYSNGDSEPNTGAVADNYITRNANAFAGSLWARLHWNKLRIEVEAVGQYASIDGTALSSPADPSDFNVGDPRLQVIDPETGNLIGEDLIALQGGLAFESDYKLLNDSLVIGLDFGIASGDSAPGFGIRPGVNESPELGDLDGQQYGNCLETGTDANGDEACASVDNTVNNFRFDPSFNIDLILFREVLGTVTDALYVKPHVSYFVTDDIGVRADFIWSNALNSESTPGRTLPLGAELDATGFYASDDGFFVMLQAGALIPLSGLGHARDGDDDELGREYSDGSRVAPLFLDPSFAWTAQAFVGVQF